jgi:hypothetical protein
MAWRIERRNYNEDRTNDLDKNWGKARVAGIDVAACGPIMGRVVRNVHIFLARDRNIG